jgi:hypothetical protein
MGKVEGEGGEGGRRREAKGGGAVTQLCGYTVVLCEEWGSIHCGIYDRVLVYRRLGLCQAVWVNAQENGRGTGEERERTSPIIILKVL